MVRIWVWTYTDEESLLEITSSPLVPPVSYSTVWEPFFCSFSLIIVCSYLSGKQRDWKLWLILENYCVVVSTAESRSHDAKAKSDLLWNTVNPISTANNAKVSSTRTVTIFGTSRMCILERWKFGKRKAPRHCVTRSGLPYLVLSDIECLFLLQLFPPRSYLYVKSKRSRGWVDGTGCYFYQEKCEFIHRVP